MPAQLETHTVKQAWRGMSEPTTFPAWKLLDPLGTSTMPIFLAGSGGSSPVAEEAVVLLHLTHFPRELETPRGAVNWISVACPGQALWSLGCQTGTSPRSWKQVLCRAHSTFR